MRQFETVPALLLITTLEGCALSTLVAVAETLHELSIDFIFTDEERQSLQQTLLTLRENPYTEYHEFAEEVRSLVKNGKVP